MLFGGNIFTLWQQSLRLCISVYIYEITEQKFLMCVASLMLLAAFS